MVTVCANTYTLLIRFIHSLQPYLYIAHRNENCSGCTFLYILQQGVQPTNKRKNNTHNTQAWDHQAEFPGAFMQYAMRNIFCGCAVLMTNPHIDPTSFSAVPSNKISRNTPAFAFLLSSLSIPLRAAAVYMLLHGTIWNYTKTDLFAPLKKKMKSSFLMLHWLPLTIPALAMI